MYLLVGLGKARPSGDGPAPQYPATWPVPGAPDPLAIANMALSAMLTQSLAQLQAAAYGAWSPGPYRGRPGPPQAWAPY